MSLYKLLKLSGGATVGERAAGIQIRHQHFFIRTKNLCRFAHEMHAAHDDDVCLCAGSPLCQGQTIPYEVGDILDIPRLVIVCQDNGILFFTQLVDFRFQVDALGNRGIHITDRLCLHISRCVK